MQRPDAVLKLPALRAGLLLAGLFGWLLAFPMFGPLLFATAGPSAPAAGLTFVFAHGAGLLLLHLLPAAGPARAWQVRTAGGVAFLLTAVSGTGMASSPPVVHVVMAVLGPAAAVLVLAWTDDWIGCGSRLGALAVAMAGANLVVALVNLPTGLLPAVWLTLMAMLILICSLPLTASPAAPVSEAAATRALPPGSILAVAAFALADFFVGGLWYNILSASVAAGGDWEPAMEALTYAVAVVVLYWRVRGRSSGQLVLYSLSAMGMGLVVATAGAGYTLTYRAILLVGLAAGDLFFWDQLGQLGKALGIRRTMGLGLGASLLLIGLANLGASFVMPTQEGPGRPFLLLGAALLFLVIPVVFRYAVGTTSPMPAAAPGEAAPTRAPMLPHLTSELTRTEREVYRLLVDGATDQEIADRLVISKHTVKFHVRNLLHKAGVANRKELLSRLIADGAAKAESNRRP